MFETSGLDKLYFTSRIRKLFSQLLLVDKQIDFVYLINPSIDLNFSYYSGISGVNSQNLFSSSLLFSIDKFILLVPKIEENNILSFIKSYSKLSDSFFKIEFFNNSLEKKSLFEKHVGLKSTIGFNGALLSYSNYKQLNEFYSKNNIKFIDVSEELNLVRQSKDELEIQNVIKANKISSKVSDEILPSIKKGISEIKLANEINNLLFEFGSIKPAFDTLVGFGKNSALAHPSVGSSKLKIGDLILLDFGATHNSGYVSDISRTYVLGSASKQQKQMYLGVYGAIQNSIEFISSNNVNFDNSSSNLTLNSVQNSSSNYLSKFPGKFTHSLGHSIGLEVHDGLSFSMDKNIPDNYITSIEPGLYDLKLGGVRIEDDYLIKLKTNKENNKIISLNSKKSLPSNQLIEL